MPCSPKCARSSPSATTPCPPSSKAPWLAATRTSWTSGRSPPSLDCRRPMRRSGCRAARARCAKLRPELGSVSDYLSEPEAAEKDLASVQEAPRVLFSRMASVPLHPPTTPCRRCWAVRSTNARGRPASWPMLGMCRGAISACACAAAVGAICAVGRVDVGHLAGGGEGGVRDGGVRVGLNVAPGNRSGSLQLLPDFAQVGVAGAVRMIEVIAAMYASSPLRYVKL